MELVRSMARLTDILTSDWFPRDEVIEGLDQWFAVLPPEPFTVVHNGSLVGALRRLKAELVPGHGKVESQLTAGAGPFRRTWDYRRPEKPQPFSEAARELAELTRIIALARGESLESPDILPEAFRAYKAARQVLTEDVRRQDYRPALARYGDATTALLAVEFGADLNGFGPLHDALRTQMGCAPQAGAAKELHQLARRLGDVDPETLARDYWEAAQRLEHHRQSVEGPLLKPMTPTWLHFRNAKQAREALQVLYGTLRHEPKEQFFEVLERLGRPADWDLDQVGLESLEQGLAACRRETADPAVQHQAVFAALGEGSQKVGERAARYARSLVSTGEIHAFDGLAEELAGAAREEILAAETVLTQDFKTYRAMGRPAQASLKSAREDFELRRNPVPSSQPPGTIRRDQDLVWIVGIPLPVRSAADNSL